MREWTSVIGAVVVVGLACGCGDDDTVASCHQWDCGDHGQCYDDTGVAVCDCDDGWAGARCAQCDAGYDSVGGDCVDQQVVSCVDAAPANATSTIADVVITYTEADGWSDPAECDWACEAGFTQVGELCEPGGSVCGDGVVEGDEACDDGNQIDGDACPDGINGTCQPAACGDGILYLGVEECDDGNNTPGDGCDAGCLWEGTCGDGNVEPGEECDLGAANSDEASGDCAAVCRTTCLCPRCGDGVTDFALGETCDDGNTGSGDGCDATCQIEPPSTCGDGVIDLPEEECDDGNTVDGDGCDSACQLEPVGQTCGDSTVDANEKCDDGNTTNGDGCNPTCNFLTQVTELSPTAPGNILAADSTHLYAFGSPTCQIHRVAIAQCQPGSCVFTPFVGAGGCGGAPVDGPGATAVIGGQGAGLAFGNGKLYFNDTHTIREVDLGSPTLEVTTLAGDPTRCGEADGVGASAVMSDIRGMVVYGPFVYFVDANMATLRRLDPVTGEVLTVAGVTPNDNAPNYTNCGALCCGSTAPATDGYGAAGTMNSPRYLTSDNAGNLFVIDTNGNALRRYNVVTTYLDTVVSGNGYVDGVGAAASMDRPRGIGSDGTSVYFAEQNLHTIRQVELATATTTTLVGVRGCSGPANLSGGVGGDGSQDWSGSCSAAAVSGLPQFTTGVTGLAYHFASRAFFVTAGGRLLRID